MRTEKSVINYFKQVGVWNIQFDTEAEMLEKANGFLEMLPNTKVVRKEAGVRSGISDLLVCYHGRFVALELKDATGVPSIQQLQFIKEIQDAGGQGAVCRTLAEVYQTLLKSR